MPLTDEEEREMYKKTLKTDWTMDLIRERLEKGDVELEDHAERLRAIEINQVKIGGKLGLIVLVMSVTFTAVLHAMGWVVSHFWK